MKNGRFNGKKLAWPLLAWLMLVAPFAGVAVSCGILTEKQRAEESVEDKPTTDEPQAGADLEHPSLGGKNAPVLMIEYADYQ